MVMSQSKGSELDELGHKSQSRRGSNSNRLRRQQPVMMHVKSLLGRTASKSPPHPTYLYVVSWMYSP
jgi:hypothetical protein